MKALVTGGGGFLGRHIVKKLLARGDSVRVLGRRDYPDLSEQGVECVKSSLTDRKNVIRACDEVDAVFHVASIAGIWGKRETYYQTNVTGTENIIAGCRKAGVPKLVYTSTPSVVYGNSPINGGDETLPYPAKFLTFYAETKAEAEKFVIGANSRQLMTCSLRPHLIWGPGDTNLIPRMVERAKSGRLMQVGDGKNLISVSYVENTAEAHLLACEALRENSPANGQCYFINEEEPVECWSFIRELLAGLGCPPLRRSVPKPLAYAIGTGMECAWKILGKESEPPMTRFLALQLATSHWFKIDKAKTDLGWTPQIDIKEGMQRLFASYGK